MQGAAGRTMPVQSSLPYLLHLDVPKTQGHGKPLQIRGDLLHDSSERHVMDKSVDFA